MTTPDLLQTTENFLIDFEVGGGRGYYDSRLIFPTQPTPESGVTIGIGYDLGQTSRDDFINDWHDQLADSVLSRLAAVIGWNRDRAAHALPSLRDIRIPWETALAVFRDKTLAQIIRDTRRVFPSLDTLPVDCQAALLSLVYNRGNSVTGPSRVEMLGIQRALHDGAPEKIPALLRSMKRLWIGKPGGPGLTLRREAEANLFEKGLASVSPLTICSSVASA